MAEEIALTFEHSAASVAVRLTAPALEVIRKQALDSGNEETGGILIGRYQDDGNVAVVTSATERPSDSISGRTWFQRGVRGLKELLRDRWRRGEHYLGEWHSHPGGTPDPSSNDFREMRAISIDSSYRCNRPLLIIAGTLAGSVELSVSVINSGRLVRLQHSPTSSTDAATWSAANIIGQKDHSSPYPGKSPIANGGVHAASWGPIFAASDGQHEGFAVVVAVVRAASADTP